MKILQTIFFVLISIMSVDHVNGNQATSVISKTRSKLNGIFNTQDEIYVIVVARNNGNMRRTSYEGWMQLRQDRLMNLSNGLLHVIASLPKDSLKIVVFDECFFQKTQPVPENDENSIINHFKQLSLLCKNSLFYLNLLSRTQCNLPECAQIIQKNRQSYAIDKDFINTQSSKRFPKNYHEDTDIRGIFKNITYGIYNGEITTSYQKRSYFAEWDAGIMQKFIYAFGSGKDVSHNKIGNKLIQNISTEICFDLCKGVRRSNNWKNNNGIFAKQSILHLLQSNSINPFCETPPNDNKNRLPKDTIIVHADSKLYQVQDLAHTPLFIVSTNQRDAIISLDKSATCEIESTEFLKPANLLTFNAVTLLNEALTGYTGKDIITISVREL